MTNMSMPRLNIPASALHTVPLSEVAVFLQTARDTAAAVPADDPQKANHLASFASTLVTAYTRTGIMAYLDEAIQTFQDVLKMTSEESPERPGRLNNLGVALSERHDATGALADLEVALQVTREASHRCTDDVPEFKAAIYSNLGDRLVDRYSITSNRDDLDEAILVAEMAVKMMPNGHPQRPGLLTNLGLRLNTRYERTGSPSTLAEAVKACQEAVEQGTEEEPDRASQLYNLAVVLGNRYANVTNSLSELDECIKLLRRALDKTSEDHPDRVTRLEGLATTLNERFQHTMRISDLKEALECRRSALEQNNAPIRDRLMTAKALMQDCALLKDWRQAYQTAKIAIPLITKLIPRPLDNADKQRLLGEAVGLASDAAAVALQAGESASVALSFLEQGRGTLAASLDELHTDLSRLEQVNPELAAKFTSLREQLEDPVVQDAFIYDQSSWHQRAVRRYSTADAFDQVILEIRAQPQFRDFLLPPTQEEMQHAAKGQPIVIVNVSQFRCDAILVQEHDVQSVALPLLNLESTKDMASGRALGTLQVLEWLWDSVANPVLTGLGFVQSAPNADTRPHIWWIPTGILSRFPLHAAGYHRKRSSESVMDRAISSYSSSIKTIMRGRRSRETRDSKSEQAHALLVAMEHTPRASRLPFAGEEVAVLRKKVQSMSLTPVEPNKRTADIITHLPDCKIFHFAGHGRTHPLDPLQSYLLLEDGVDKPLKVADLLGMNLREHQPFLAYLSACGTGRIKDEKFADESIHLISAFQLAGFRHVIGTLWEVNDETCLDVASIIYEELASCGMTDESICRGLHKAARELRDRWLQQLEVSSSQSERQPRDILPDSDDEGTAPAAQWVPYVHFGV